MSNYTDKIFWKAKTVSLKTDEKAFLRESILSVIQKGKPIPSPYRNTTATSFFFFISKRQYSVALSVVLILFLTAGTSFAAQNALPGEPLYSVKVNVNEQVETLLAVSSEASAEVNAKLTLRRIDEAEQLAAQNKLTPETNEEIKKSISNSITALNKSTEELKQKGNLDALAKVSDNFESELNSHVAIISEADAATGSASTEINTSVQMKVMSLSVEAPTSSSEGLEKQTATDSGEKESVNAEFLAAKSELDALKSAFSPEATTSIQNSIRSSIAIQKSKMFGAWSSQVEVRQLQGRARVTLGEQYLLLGKAKFDAGDFAQASAFFKRSQKAFEDAQKLGDSSSNENTTTADENSASSSEKDSSSQKGKGSGVHLELNTRTIDASIGKAFRGESHKGDEE